MLPLTTEWVGKAEGDLATAKRELRARKNPNYDAACFHAQQCVEKYLKACLQETGTPFPQTHNLDFLLDLLRPLDPSWETQRGSLTALNTYAVGTRYPGDWASRTDPRDALRLADGVRKFARQQLGLPPD